MKFPRYRIYYFRETTPNYSRQVEYIQFIKSIPSEEGRNAELALYRRQPNEAERILLQAAPPLVYRAIKMNIHLYRWNRALDLAIKYRTHVDTCLGYRQRFLEQFGRRETDQRFLQYANQVRFVLILQINKSQMIYEI